MVTQNTLLHRAGPAGALANLGLWSGEAQQHYAQASAALATAVGQAARLQPGARVLSLGCGTGEELRLWTRHFGAAEVIGADPAPGAVAAARRHALSVLQADAHRALGQAEGDFDAILSVDALYHASPRTALWALAWQRLRPGGRLAFCDLTLDTPPGVALRAAGRTCGVDVTDLAGIDSRCAELRASGFVEVEATALDAAVLGGFQQFASRQKLLLRWTERLQPAWWRVAITAALIPPARSAGLGYALFAATRPP